MTKRTDTVSKEKWVSSPNDEKKQVVSDLSETFLSAKSIVFVDYAGMGVSVQQELRSKLAEVGGRMVVAKNTLSKVALNKAGINGDFPADEVLQGQTAFILADEDAVAPIQTLGEFTSENELPQIKAGFVEGTYQDKEGVLKISKLPSKNELYAQVVGATMAPSYGLVGMLQGNLQKLVFILNEASKGSGLPLRNEVKGGLPLRNEVKGGV